MKTANIILRRPVFALAIVGLAAVVSGGPAFAQSAERLQCNGCVFGKHIRNGTINGRDIRNGAVGGPKIRNNAITSGKIVDGEVDTPDLADNAVTSDKIADGQVGTPDLAAGAVTSIKIDTGAVGSAAVAGNSVPASDLSNEAGAGFNGALVFLDLETTDQIVRSVTITAPSAGVVVVNASGFFEFFAVGRDTGICSITTESTLDDSALIVGDAPGDSVMAMPFAGTRGFNLPASGSATFNLVCLEEFGDVQINYSQMTAIFVPTVY